MIDFENNFAVFILSHKRADKVLTLDTLARHNYTGKCFVIVDDMDDTIEQYKKKFGDKVIVFDKKRIGDTFDRGDNFNNYKSTSYVRNAIWDIAESLKLKYFIQLDDDYTHFRFRFDNKFDYSTFKLGDITPIFKQMVEFLESTPIKTICMAQGGDFVGGADKVKIKRKAMNSFVCSVARRFTFVGRLNEDVNTYVVNGSRGDLYFTTNQIDLAQLETQQNSGGMTDTYLQFGTYVKSFYSVMYHPSSVKVSWALKRIHHHISWKHTVPKILRETVKNRQSIPA